MLVTFSSQAFENIVMFGDVARQLLTLMGHSGTIPGALVADEVAGALQQLQTAIGQQPDSAVSRSQDDGQEAQAVSLAHRAVPLISMLKSAVKHKSNVMWQ